MTIPDQAIVLGIIATTMVLFFWGRWRYDLVALVALLAAVYCGVVPAHEAFAGLGHPAVITVAAVLIISRSLQLSGLVADLSRFLALSRRTTISQIAAEGTLAATLSAIMNNVGALALMLPVTVRNAARAKRSPSQVLMPLSFASLLGGLVTLIGTPPNIVISTYRETSTGAPFEMFDFTPVGLVVALAGLTYLITIGWRLLPQRISASGNDAGRFHVGAYVSEAVVPAGSPYVGQQVRTLEQVCENDIAVMAIVRGQHKLLAPSGIETFRVDDILILEGDPAALEPLTDGIKLDRTTASEWGAGVLRSKDVVVIEAIVMPNAPIENRSVRGLRMHDRYGVNLLAMSRRGGAPKTRLTRVRFKAGDVLLLQGETQVLRQTLEALGCLALAGRAVELSGRQRTLMPIGVFGAAIAAASLGLLPVPIAFVTAAVALVVLGSITLREAYDSIEWPIIILLASLIPIGGAMKATGGAASIAGVVLSHASTAPVWLMIALLMVMSMWLSDLIHNTPTAVLMAPIAAGIAAGLGMSIDAFLMAVAVGSASPFLTPIGHQSNTLVMGPGGYRFTDYARLGLPMQMIVVATAVPTIMLVWAH